MYAYFTTDADVLLDTFGAMTVTNPASEDAIALLIATVGPGLHAAFFDIVEPVPGSTLMPLPWMRAKLDSGGRPYVGPPEIEMTA